MTEQSLWFEHNKDNRQVRVVEEYDDRWMPVSDIAGAIDYDRTSLVHLLERNKELFAGLKGYSVMPSPGGDQTYLCLNRDGVVGLLMKLDYLRIKDMAKRERVIAFQKWAISVLSKELAGKAVVPAPVKPPAIQVDEKKLTSIPYEASKFARATGADPRVVLMKMLDRHGYSYLVDTIPSVLPVLAPASPKPAGWLNASEIAEIVGGKAGEINQFLYNKQLIIKDGENPGEWRITLRGKAYGDEFPYSPHPDHNVYRVYWRRDVLRLFGVGGVPP